MTHYDTAETLDELVEIATGNRSPRPTRLHTDGLTVEHIGRIQQSEPSEYDAATRLRYWAGLIRVWRGDDVAATVEIAPGEDDPALIREAIDEALTQARAVEYGQRLTDARTRLEAAEAATTAARAERDELIREAITAGWTMYRVAQLVGISQQAVRSIRDKA